MMSFGYAVDESGGRWARAIVDADADPCKAVPPSIEAVQIEPLDEMDEEDMRDLIGGIFTARSKPATCWRGPG